MKRTPLGTTAAAALAGTLLLVVACGGADASPDGQAAGAGEGEAARSVEGRFVGIYELQSFQSFPEEGEPVDRDYVARIAYDEHGNMMAVGMPRDLPDRAGGDDSSGSGFAYFGTFSVDPDAGTVTHHVEGSPTMPDWVAGGQVRHYELDGDILRLSIRNGEGRTTGTLTWRRF